MKKLTATILYMDGHPDSDGEYFLPDDVEISDEYVSIRRNFDITDPPIGRALLKKEGTQLVANIELLDNVKGAFTPAIGGNYSFKKKTETGIKCGTKVHSIGFCKSNTDPRIQEINVE